MAPLQQSVKPYQVLSMRSGSLLVLVTICSLLTPALSWGELGHMIVAKIAQNKLVDERLNPDAFIWAQNILQATKTDSYETNWPVVECAGWADRLRNVDRTSASWHFVAMPILSSDFTAAYPTPSSEPNITLKLLHMFQTLSVKQDSKIFNLTNQGNALRFAIHLMGDIHQPLHDACKFSKKNPKGDAGANLVTVVFDGKTTNLHTVWDSLFNKVSYIKSPLTENTQKAVANAAKEIAASAHLKSEIQTTMFTDNYGELSTYLRIAEESYQLAVDYAHGGVEDGCTLSEAYISRGFSVVQTRLVEGGLRLAYFLNAAYKASQSGAKVSLQ